MQREIKFRGWDGKIMFDVSQITFNDGTWDLSKGRGVSILFQPSITLMQFTGLHDKNGKEIYEGDVVRVKSGSATPISVTHEGETLTAYRANYDTCFIVFYKSAFCLHNEKDIKRHQSESKYNGTSYYGTLQSAHHDIEVIGNIYENPELTT